MDTAKLFGLTKKNGTDIMKDTDRSRGRLKNVQNEDLPES